MQEDLARHIAVGDDGHGAHAAMALGALERVYAVRSATGSLSEASSGRREVDLSVAAPESAGPDTWSDSPPPTRISVRIPA
jgi:hypothetical protein